MLYFLNNLFITLFTHASFITHLFQNFIYSLLFYIILIAHPFWYSIYCYTTPFTHIC